MEMREQLQYIDKLTNAIDRNDFESFQKKYSMSCKGIILILHRQCYWKILIILSVALTI